jgi:hypothetical protein
MEPVDPFFTGGLTIRAASHFEERLEALKSALTTGTPGSIVEEAKALLECVYRTIVTDHNGDVAPGARGGPPTFPELYSQAKACINLSEDSDVESRIDEACSKLTLIIGQTRNSNGATSHGQDAYSENLLGLHEAHFIAREALSIAALFLNRHSVSEAHLYARLRFEDHNDFNEYIDESEEWPAVLGQEMRPSEVLFNTDPTSYRAALTEYRQRPEEDEAEIETA